MLISRPTDSIWIYAFGVLSSVEVEARFKQEEMIVAGFGRVCCAAMEPTGATKLKAAVRINAKDFRLAASLKQLSYGLAHKYGVKCP